MTVLAFTREHVEVDAADPFLAGVVEDVVVLDFRMPDRHLGALEVDAIQRAGDLQHPRHHGIAREVLAQGILVDAVALGFQLLLPVAGIPAHDRCIGRRQAGDLDPVVAQLIEFTSFDLLDGGTNFAEEALDCSRLAGHLAPDGEVGVARQAEQARHFLAQVHRLLQGRQIFRRAAIGKRDLITLAGLGIVSVFHEWVVAWIIKAKQIVALRIALGSCQPGRWHAPDLIGSKYQLLVVVADGAGKFLRQFIEPAENCIHALALCCRQCHTGIFKALQHILAQLGLDRVGWLDGLETGI